VHRRRHVLVIVLWSAAGLLLVIIAGFVAANVVIRLDGRSHSVATVEQAPAAPVAIVLGARVHPDGTPYPMLADRLDSAVALYKAGKVRKLLLSGDHGTTHYDETNAMRRYVLARGIPAEDIFMDHAGFSTYDTMYRARDVFQVTQALVVTQRFHLDRAVYTARRLGLEVTGVPADQNVYADTFKYTVRDWLARCKAFLDLNLLHPLPRFLGPAIPISGDGRATLD
jgi:SanA protein